MSQTMVNFRLDENIKRDMESACREMGLSMTAAFTIFATKVGRERRIPFELTAERSAGSLRRGSEQERGSEMPETIMPGAESELLAMRGRLEAACGEIRRSLTNLHISIPASRTGLTVEKIRLLCGDELKDKTAGTLSGIRSILADRNLPAMAEKDMGLLQDYADALSRIRSEVKNMEVTLAPALRSPEAGAGDEGFALRLNAVSAAFDELPEIMSAFLSSTARKQGSARALQGRLRRAAAWVRDPGVRTAVEGLEELILQRFDALPARSRGHLESHYFQTLALTLGELERAEREGEAAAEKAALCLRVIDVMEQTIEEGRRRQDVLSSQSLEAEVAALERIAAMRGDIPDGLLP